MGAELGPAAIKKAITAALNANLPLYIWGDAGIGKTTIASQVAEDLELEYCDVRVALLDQVDLRGLPAIQDGRAVWYAPDFLPIGKEDWQGVIMLDELAYGMPAIQSTVLQLVQQRRIGEHVLPEGARILAASNRPQDNCGTNRIIKPLGSRFVHVTMTVSNEDWQRWAIHNSISPEIRSFLNFKPGLLCDPPENADAHLAYPNPRTWEFASKVVKARPDSTVEFAMLAGCVGEAGAAELLGFSKIYRQLPNPDDILDNPESHKMPTEPGVLYALCGALADRVGTGNRLKKNKVLNAIAVFATRMAKEAGREFSVVLFKDSYEQDKSIVKLDTGKTWLRDNRDVLLGEVD